MHITSLENMSRCIDWYLDVDTVNVVDLGSKNVNGSYRDLFPKGIRYIGVDLEPGSGVDVVLEDVYKLPFDNESCDLIISGQMLEHCGQFWRLFQEIQRILRPGGKAFIIAPSAGPIHNYPVDCYRFYPDSFEALADWSELRLIHSWRDDRGPWCDMVGVFQKGGKQERVSKPTQRKIGSNEPISIHSVATSEHRKGARNYLEVLSDLHEIIRPDLYLEIGVRKGASIKLCQGRALGIDPEPHPDLKLDNTNIRLFRCTSDDYFFFTNKPAFSEPVQLAFIDGMHLSDYVLRDFMNIERCMSPDGVIVIDDVLPNHPIQAQRVRASKVWAGDVWRFVESLEKWRPKLKLTWLDTDPTGLLIISNLNPDDKTLWENYNKIAGKLIHECCDYVPSYLIDRSRAHSPTVHNIRMAIGK